jgi:phage baseplate assembly protein W
MTKDVIGRGFGFPVRLVGGRVPLLGGPAKIRQSIEIILSTAPGERQMLPEFGCGIHELVFQPNTAALRGVVQGKVRDALIRWEPRIDILDVRVETAEEERNVLTIYVDYRVRADNSFFNLVYPYYLVEGAR